MTLVQVTAFRQNLFTERQRERGGGREREREREGGGGNVRESVCVCVCVHRLSFRVHADQSRKVIHLD